MDIQNKLILGIPWMRTLGVALDLCDNSTFLSGRGTHPGAPLKPIETPRLERLLEILEKEQSASSPTRIEEVSRAFSKKHA